VGDIPLFEKNHIYYMAQRNAVSIAHHPALGKTILHRKNFTDSEQHVILSAFAT
jgi:hypothetical protein